MSWEQLSAIIQQNKQQAQQERQQPPVACPIDGSILDINARGMRNCPMGNFTWSGGLVT